MQINCLLLIQPNPSHQTDYRKTDAKAIRGRTITRVLLNPVRLQQVAKDIKTVNITLKGSTLAFRWFKLTIFACLPVVQITGIVAQLEPMQG